MDNLFPDYITLDERAKDGEVRLVSNPESGDIAAAYWTGSMWAYDQPTMVEQLDFEPTHYRVAGR